MAVRAEKTLTAVSASPWVVFNQHETPFNVSFGVVPNSAASVSATTFRVEHTFENVIAGATPTSSQIFIHEDVSANSVAVDGNYAFPIAAARLRLVAVSASAPSITATFLQASE